MHEQSLYQLQQDTILVVPTGSLATHLNETLAAQKIQREQQVWEAPNILSWAEWLRLLWQYNRTEFGSIHSVIGTQQSKLMWTQVIEKSKYASNELALLNVQQTVRACMRSDRLLADWRCDEVALRADHVPDIDQFLLWRDDYHNALEQRRIIDEPRLQTALIELLNNGRLQLKVKRFVWYAYDLLSAAQKRFNALIEATGVELIFGGPKPEPDNVHYVRFENDKQELEAVFADVRRRLGEQPEQKIHVVVPDLQHRYSQVQEIARQTFYPNSSLVETQNNSSVYRLSLGRAMQESPAIEVALCVLSSLKSSLSISDVGFLLRSVFLGVIQRNKDDFWAFEHWLKAQRLRSVSLDRLPALLAEYEQFQQQNDVGLPTETASSLRDFIEKISAFRVNLNDTLKAQKENSGYSVRGFSEWAQTFAEWLALWQWQTNSVNAELSSVAHQLRKRWDGVLEEFASLGTVQRNVGLSNAINSFQQLVRDTVFMPKSVASPVVVSGLLEALGRETDVCFLTGMTEDFPAANKGDAFIPNHHLLNTGYPDASPQTSVDQAKKVMQSLLASSKFTQISFALGSAVNQDEHKQASPLFSSHLSGAELNLAPSKTPRDDQEHPQLKLEAYQDTQGPAWSSPNTARGGASIFKNQSLCAFKAFVTHQLRFEVEQELEFGLDHLDRGNLTHRMLELVWQRFPNQSALKELSDAQQTELLSSTFDQLLSECGDALNDDKLRLFAFEKTRVIELAKEWLEIERKRPTDFSVVEIESKYRGEWAGIKFDYIIDRVDVTEAGQSVIVDYKTGMVSKNDWQGERPFEPQLPLYALVRDELKSTKVAGIAYGQVRRGDSKYVELAQANIFRADTKRTADVAQQWAESREQWPDVFTRLAKEFLAGEAAVNPIDSKACQYCELSAVCRIEELRERSKLNVLSDKTNDGLEVDV